MLHLRYTSKISVTVERKLFIFVCIIYFYVEVKKVKRHSELLRRELEFVDKLTPLLFGSWIVIFTTSLVLSNTQESSTIYIILVLVFLASVLVFVATLGYAIFGFLRIEREMRG